MEKNTNYDKLLDALEYIKAVCEAHIEGGCPLCPLSDEKGECCLRKGKDMNTHSIIDKHAQRGA